MLRTDAVKENQVDWSRFTFYCDKMTESFKLIFLHDDCLPSLTISGLSFLAMCILSLSLVAAKNINTNVA